MAANGKLANGKLSLASTKLIQNKLLPGYMEARIPEENSNQDNNNIKLLFMKVDKKPRTAAANKKLAGGNSLEIRQDMRAKKVLTLKTS